MDTKNCAECGDPVKDSEAHYCYTRDCYIHERCAPVHEDDNAPCGMFNVDP